MDYVNFDKTLQYVIKAVTANASQLLLSALLQLIVIFIYTLLAFFNVTPDFWRADIGIDQHGENYGYTVFQCF